MKTLRTKIDDGFAAAAQLFYHNPWKTITGVLGLVAVLATQLANIKIDTSTEGLLHKNDPALIEYHQFRHQFGRDQLLIIALRDEDIFNPAFLETLRDLHHDLESRVPHVEEITSLINARNTRGEQDRLIVEDLFANWPESPSALDRIKQRTLANPLYRNILVSEDHQYTAILIKTNNYTGQDTTLDLSAFDDQPAAAAGSGTAGQLQFITEKENSETVEAVLSVVQQYRDKGLEAYVAGSSAVTHCFAKAMVKDLSLFMGLSLLVIATILYILFRRLSAVFLPLSVVVLSLIATVGFTAANDVAIKMPTQVLPSFLMAVGVGYAVHILALFYHRHQNGTPKEDALVASVRHCGLPVTLTAVTTAGGLFSFVSADVAPIANLGLYAGIGTIMVLLFAFSLLPPLVALLPIQTRSQAGPSGKGLTQLLSSISRAVSRHAYWVLAIAAIVMVISIVGLARLRFSHDVIRWLPRQDPLRVASERLDSVFQGAFNLEVIIDSGRENGLYEPGFLNRLEQAAESLEKLEVGGIFAGKAWSLTSILKEINQALNEGDPGSYRVAQSRNLIAQQLLLFENSGSDDMEDVCDRQYRTARMTVKVPLRDAIAYGRFIDEVNAIVQRELPGAGIKTTGMIMLYAKTMTNTIMSMAESYVISFIVITVLMVLLLGHVRTGLLSMVPNLMPIIVTLGIMGWTGKPLNLFTIMIGSIAIGLAVDDTIHFMHNFRKYQIRSGDAEWAVRETFLTAGRALLATSCVLSCGFFIFMFARMKNFFDFGLLTGFTIIMALVADFFLSPALVIAVQRWTAKKKHWMPMENRFDSKRTLKRNKPKVGRY
jgi:predicted RND superfamily exporter protein